MSLLIIERLMFLYSYAILEIILFLLKGKNVFKIVCKFNIYSQLIKPSEKQKHDWLFHIILATISHKDNEHLHEYRNVCTFERDKAYANYSYHANERLHGWGRNWGALSIVYSLVSNRNVILSAFILFFNIHMNTGNK